MATTPLPGNWQSSSILIPTRSSCSTSWPITSERKHHPMGSSWCQPLTQVWNSRGSTRTQLKEEADTRIIIRVADCAAQGYIKITIRTGDTGYFRVVDSLYYRENIPVHRGTHYYIKSWDVQGSSSSAIPQLDWV